ncbi:MAG: hypothetical protein ACRDKZ_04345 [Actinomycetota bacterium]
MDGSWATLGFASLSIAVGALLLVIGYLVVDALLGPALRRNEAWALSFAGTTAFALSLMVLHMLTGGGVLSSSPVTLGLTAAVVAGCITVRIRRRENTSTEGLPAWLLAAVVTVGLLVWCTPVARMVPLDYGGDVHLHTAYAAQLLNGEQTPTAAITGDIPNFYPWLTHALTALTVRLTPGGSVYGALSALQIAQVSGMLLALVALGYRLGRNLRAAVFAALFGGLSGGFGFLLLRGLDVVIQPRINGERYLGDLLYKRSYNAAFFNVTPPFPRDVALTLLVISVALLVAGLNRGRTRILVAAGVMIGAAGLMGAEAFYVGLGTVLLLVVLPPPALSRLRLLGLVVIPALAVYGLWLVPQLFHWLELGGYRNITLVAPVTLSALAIVVSWGLMTPFAIGGAGLTLRRARADPGVRVLVALALIAAAAVIGATALSELLGEAFLAIGRPHRYWPLLYLALALIAALGATAATQRLDQRRDRALLMALVVLIGLISPTLTSLALPQERPLPEPLQRAVRGDDEALLNILDRRDGVSCHLAVPPLLTFLTQTYTGHRHVLFSYSPLHEGNLARIRWADIYDRIPDDEERREANRRLVSGHGGLTAWLDAVDRFEVDAIVIKEERADQLPFSTFRREEASDLPYTVVRVTDCTG